MEYEVRVPAFLIDLIPQYLTNRRKEIDVLRTAIASEDFKQIRSIGHKLKGNAGSYGFYQLSQIGEALENAALKEDISAARSSELDYFDYLKNVYVLPA